MTVAELSAVVQALPEFHSYYTTPELVETNEAGDQCYLVKVRMVSGVKISYISAYYWVKDLGLPSEEAWYWDRSPITLEEIVGGA